MNTKVWSAYSRIVISRYFVALLESNVVSIDVDETVVDSIPNNVLDSVTCTHKIELQLKASECGVANSLRARLRKRF